MVNPRLPVPSLRDGNGSIGVKGSQTDIPIVVELKHGGTFDKNPSSLNGSANSIKLKYMRFKLC